MARAGHCPEFVSQGWCDCGVRWAIARDADETCLNQEGYAHVGGLNSLELREIRELRTEEEERFRAALHAATGS